MKKKSFTFFVVFLSFLTHAQKNVNKILVEYTSTEGAIVNHEKLIATQNEAIYLTDSLFYKYKDGTNIIKEEDANTISIRPKSVKFDPNIYRLNLNSNIVYFNKKMNGEVYTIRDSMPKMKWNIINGETKKINNFICNKATLNFRGTKFVAYYTEDIPIYFGPWKFKGLPGLILEIYSVSGNIPFHWIAKKIIYPYENEKKITFSRKKVVSLRTYIKYIENLIKSKMMIMDSRIPKGATIISSRLVRSGIEKKYEWEK